MIDILHFFRTVMVTPKPFGAWHLTSIFLVVATIALLVWRFRRADEKTVRIILLCAWVLMVLGEVYKQITFTYNFAPDGTVIKDYMWHVFPYQFCSTPLYVLPFAALLPNGRVRDAFLVFLCTFSLFGGFAVYCLPGDVFVSLVGVNIQTMLHHGLQIVVGVYLAVRYRDKLCLRRFLGALAVFACLVVIAVGLNIGMHHYLVATAQNTEAFNMFYLSPYYECYMPVLSIIRPLVPYGVFLPIYVLGFALIGIAVLGMEVGISRLLGGKRRSSPRT